MIENGTNMPSIEAATLLCDRYHLTLDWIYFGEMSGLRTATSDAIRKIRYLRHELNEHD